MKSSASCNCSGGLSRETAFRVIDRRGHLEGHAVTFVFCSQERKRRNVEFSSICNCSQWLSTCCYALLIEGETKVNSFLRVAASQLPKRPCHEALSFSSKNSLRFSFVLAHDYQKNRSVSNSFLCWFKMMFRESINETSEIFWHLASFCVDEESRVSCNVSRWRWVLRITRESNGPQIFVCLICFKSQNATPRKIRK